MRRWWPALLALVVLLAGGGTAVALRQDGSTSAEGPVATPSPEPVRTPLLAPTKGVVPTAAGLRRALAAGLRDRALGTLALSVVDATTGDPLLELGADRAVTPASTAKVVTAVAALTVLDPTTRFRTRLLTTAGGDLVLQGGGDPTLAGAHPVGGYPVPARLADLAAQVRGTAVTRIVVDDALFGGPRLGPGWKPSYVTSGDVAPVGALMVDGGRVSDDDNAGRAADPALEAGRQLAALLKVKAVVRGTAPADAVEVAHVDSPTVAQLVEAMLTRSDNDLAEALGRHTALAKGQPATFAGEVAAARDALAPLVDGAGSLGLRDASGLSPLDRLQPAALTRVLAAAGRDPRFGPLLSGLPVAGFDGTLAKRYRTAPTSVAAGQVRAKTGTLNGVSALAGLVRTRGGALLAFDATANGVPLTGTLAAQRALDRLAATLASCGCP